jgi:hypothetical protein
VAKLSHASGHAPTLQAARRTSRQLAQVAEVGGADEKGSYILARGAKPSSAQLKRGSVRRRTSSILYTSPSCRGCHGGLAADPSAETT